MTRKKPEAFGVTSRKIVPSKLLTLAAVVLGLIAVGAIGYPIMTGMFGSTNTNSDRNPAFAGADVAELPLEVKIHPENIAVSEDKWSTIKVSLKNPKDFDITKDLVLEFRNASYNTSTSAWNSFGSYTTLVTFGSITVHPGDTVKLSVPVLLKAGSTDSEDVTASDRRLYNFKLKTA